MSVQRSGRSQSFGVVCTVANRDRAVLEAFQERWGGGIYTRKAVGNNNECHQWFLTRQKARPFLLAMKGRVRLKRRQVQLALMFYDMTQAEKVAAKEEMKTLNGRGRASVSV